MLAQERDRSLPRVGSSLRLVDFRPSVVEERVIGVLIDLYFNLLAEIFYLPFDFMDHRGSNRAILVAGDIEHGGVQVRQIGFHFWVSAVEDHTSADLRVLRRRVQRECAAHAETDNTNFLTRR